MTKLTLGEFLKKYSLLSNEFIDDIYDFIINLEVIAKWLRSHRDINYNKLYIKLNWRTKTYKQKSENNNR